MRRERAEGERARTLTRSRSRIFLVACSPLARGIKNFQKDSLARSPLTRHIFARILSEKRDHNWCQKRKKRYFLGIVIGQIKPVHIFLADFITEASENHCKTDYS